MPARFDEETLLRLDLDIDMRCYMDSALKVLDEDEFGQTRGEMSYPEEVVALAARDEVLRLGKDGTFPFNHETQIWDGMFE